MRPLPIAAATLLIVAACQSTTPRATEAPPPVKAAQKGCSANAAREYQRIDQKIAILEKQAARGYRTSNTVVRVANPLKLCTGVVPLVAVCLPTPRPKSTLPSYQEHQAMQKELDRLTARKAALAACAT
ncbi:hypothetical protein GCM10016455_15930 [Aliiroseovarius zhejiangensis]|uniref:Lipoprotein n=1 Tax=Aliiroseovarius zhejiangensis TaxID=1632025 RepID=A0ABQ3J078_9RHOB|nr:hypothetical protein [Aliiroseovarius zhejiangensis]GHE96379.1 hypothetical protein GCM10016455_15930 [Aliiroseovarius zhejiangensis]